MRRGDSALWIVGDPSQELRLEAQGRTNGNDPLPAEPWLLRSFARGGNGAAANTRWTLLAVGGADAPAPVLQPEGAGYLIGLPGEARRWSVQNVNGGVDVRPGSEAPARPAINGGNAASPAAGNEVMGSLDPLARGLGATARRIFTQPAGETLLIEYPDITFRAGEATLLPLPALAGVKRVQVQARGPATQDISIDFMRGDSKVGSSVCSLSTAKPYNEWKGYAIDYVTGEATADALVSADAVKVTAALGGRSVVRVFGEPVAPFQGSIWKSLTLWPRPAGAPWVACLDQDSRLTVVDATGSIRWTYTSKPKDIIAVAAGKSGPARLALLRSDETIEVLDEAGRLVWKTSFHEVARTAFGNVPFRALWRDCNGDGIDDLLVGEFCFEAALDGRDGRLLGQSEFLALFWPQEVAVSNGPNGPRLWTAPSTAASLKMWDIKTNETTYFKSETARPEHGGNTLYFGVVRSGDAERLIQVRENMVWARNPQAPAGMPGQYQNLDRDVDWLWQPPSPLVAGGVAPSGEILTGDLVGRLYLLDSSGKVIHQKVLPEAAAQILALPGRNGVRWWVGGAGGGGWLLDSKLQPVASAPERSLFQRNGDVLLQNREIWWANASGRDVNLLSFREE